MIIYLKIEGCEDCPHKDSERLHAAGSNEPKFDWTCQAAERRIAFMDWDESHAPIPEWCPLIANESKCGG